MSDEPIKIDTGIPIPPARGKSWSKWAPVLEAMQVGDSFLVPGNEYTGRAAIAGLAARRGIKVVIRATDEGLRVWRTQ